MVAYGGIIKFIYFLILMKRMYKYERKANITDIWCQ